MAPFSDSLWTSIQAEVFPAILDHPFIEELASGELSEQAFRFYVRQDAAYLEAFGKGLAVLAAKAPLSGDFLMFCEHARNTLLVEEALHQEFLAEWSDDPPPPDWNMLAPNGLLYTSYLLRVALERPYHEGVAAFLPCYWIYREVGRHLVSRGSPHALYQRWIDTYPGEAFGQVVREILACVNRIAEPLSECQKAAMRSHFRRTSQLEYLFWDMGYHRQGWPFPDVAQP
jgi:thiaminase/transcriptional activator TenA